MRRRLALLLTLTFIFSLLPTMAASPNTGTSNTGVRVLRLPDSELGTAVAINDSGWIAMTASVWSGVGYPIDLWPELSAVDPGGGSLSAVDLDSTGEVVGTYQSGSGFASSFLWSDGPGMQLLGQRTATAIDGDIVGYTTGPSFIGRPGAFDSIPDPPVGGFVATGIRNGLVLGNGRTWDGAYVDLQENGVAYEMNSSGTIAGHIGDGAGGIEAAYWPSRSAAPVRLGFLGNDTMSQAWAINDDGWIVGWSGTSTAQADKRAFVWRPGSAMTDLGFFPGDAWAEAFDINNAGVIVGKSGYGPVIWDSNGTFPMDYPPEVEPFGPLQVSAGQLLSETIMISDYEGDPYTVEWTGLPSGADWDGSEVTWQTSAGEEGSYPIALTVTQVSEPLNTITVDTTIEVGAPAPTLDPIGNQTATVGQELAFTVSASPGSSGNSLSYFLTAATAMGASVNPASGAFSWTPAPGSEGEHAVTIRVTETVCHIFTDPFCTTPTLTDEEAITVTVTGSGMDQPPVLTAIVETIDEHETLSIPRSAFLSDPDTPIGDITLSLEDGVDPVPPTALINGIFEWTPGELDGGSTYEFVMRAADTANPPNEATAPITITVLETSERPAIAPVLPQNIEVGQTLNVTVTATDADIPVDDLTFSMFEGPGSIHPVTGLYEFTPTSPGPVSAWVVVSDGQLDDLAEIVIDVTDSNLRNDVALDLAVIDGDPDADGIVDLGTPITLRARITETNLGVSNVDVEITLPGEATLVSSTANACERTSINGDTTLACDVGSVSTSEDLDIVVTLEDTQVYDIIAEVTSSANPETDATNNSDRLTLESRIRVSIDELIGVSDVADVIPPLNLVTILEAIGVDDLVDVVPPLDLATILESIAVGDGVDVIPPLTLNTILEAIGVTDTTGVVPPLNLATIIENVAVTDSGELVYDTDGSGIPDVTATAVDPITGQPLSEAVPGTEVLIAGSGLLPNSPATVVLFSDPMHLADIVTDGDGSFAVVVTIPEDTAAGEHRIIVTGEWQHGGPIEVIFPIDVLGLCTITGTDGFDILVGTSGDDVICGLGGNDLIFGGRGDDLIFGGAGNDLIFGSRGTDDLFGEEGDDVLFGGWGDDHLAGGPGADFLIGGPGDDTILQ